MSAAVLFDTILQSVLLGGLYALFATGLALVFGVMRLVNLAHGDLIVLSAYIFLAVGQAVGIDDPYAPIYMLPLVAALMALIGYVLQRGLFNFVLGKEAVLRPLMVTFGLSIILQNVLLEAYSADSRHIAAGGLNTASVTLAPGVVAGLLPILVLVCAVGVLGALHAMLYRTALGRTFRATSDDPDMARALGVHTGRVFGQASAIAFAVMALAGLMLGLRTSFDPASGPTTLIFAFEAVIIGGLGNLWGTLAGGIILGLAQGIAGRVDPNWQIIAGHLCFLAVLLVRPRGLFPKVEHR